MTKDEIQKNIYGLSTDEEIVEFVKFRLKELEDGSMETTVGQNYTDTFRENIYLYKRIIRLEINLETRNVQI